MRNILSLAAASTFMAASASADVVLRNYVFGEANCVSAPAFYADIDLTKLITQLASSPLLGSASAYGISNPADIVSSCDKVKQVVPTLLAQAQATGSSLSILGSFDNSCAKVPLSATVNAYTRLQCIEGVDTLTAPPNMNYVSAGVYTDAKCSNALVDIGFKATNESIIVPTLKSGITFACERGAGGTPVFNGTRLPMEYTMCMPVAQSALGSSLGLGAYGTGLYTSITCTSGSPGGSQLAAKISDYGRTSGGSLKKDFAGVMNMAFTNKAGAADVLVNVTASPYPIKSANAAAVGRGLNTYFDFDTTSSSFSADITYNINKTFIDTLGYSASSLAWAYFDETAQKWTTVGGSVKTGTDGSQTLVYTTDHFSEWTIVSSSAFLLVPSTILAVAATFVSLGFSF